MMSDKAVITVEILVPVSRSHEGDSGISKRDLADFIAGGIMQDIKKVIKSNKRKPEITQAICSYHEKFKVDY